MFATLMYHLIDEDKSDPMCVKLSVFRDQIAALQKLGRPLLHLADVDEMLAGRTQATNGILVTFDDGYTNTIDTVLPILNNLGIPAVLALCAAYVLNEDCGTRRMHISDSFASPQQVKTWLAAGMDIAGHSYTHRRLPLLSGDELHREIGEDKKLLEGLFDRTIQAFIYPYGDMDSRVSKIVGHYYRIAFSDGRGYPPSLEQRLAVKRLRVRPEWSMDQFLEALSSNNDGGL